MRKIRFVLILAAILSIPASFADELDMSNSKACATVASACSNAGFDRTQTSGKRFWQDCMKPILMGKTVANVTVDSATAKTCRMDKIQELKKELNEFQKVH